MKRLALVLALCLAGTASAGPFSDLVLAEGVFAETPAGLVLRYGLNPTAQSGGAAAELHMTVLEEAGAKILLVEEDDGTNAIHEVARFPASSANPVLLYFLENLVRDMSGETGGSPFYIRNRIRDALVAEDAAPDADGRVSATILPFADDPNAARLGEFAGLQLQLEFDAAHPEILLSLKADTGTGTAGYTRHMILIGGE